MREEEIKKYKLKLQWWFITVLLRGVILRLLVRKEDTVGTEEPFTLFVSPQR